MRKRIFFTDVGNENMSCTHLFIVNCNTYITKCQLNITKKYKIHQNKVKFVPLMCCFISSKKC